MRACWSHLSKCLHPGGVDPGTSAYPGWALRRSLAGPASKECSAEGHGSLGHDLRDARRGMSRGRIRRHSPRVRRSPVSSASTRAGRPHRGRTAARTTEGPSSPHELSPREGAAAQAYIARVTHSATSAGLSSPSISTVKLRVVSIALPFNSTFAVTARARMRDPTFTGLTNRTRLKP